ncbi:MAG: KilA-N domain-containing protein [Victivallales bacterium]|nr:KilA-N domain-containing protein [Victivallales bacterium]
MTKKQGLVIKDISVGIFTYNKGDFISLTDIAKYKNQESTGLVISHWLSTRYCIEFMGLWEKIHNPNFNVTEFSNIKNESGSNGFILSSKKWIENTKAIGIVSKPGRYGGTYAHKDIAFEFATWISAEFKLYLIKEFQRLKTEENERKNLEWDVKRTLTKMNYKIHTDAIKLHLIPGQITALQSNIVYANEADILNMALFGKTSQQWRIENSDKDGNIRDYADVRQLVCLANLESLNAEFIRQKISQSERLTKLNEIAVIQMKVLIDYNTMKELE